MNDEKNEYVCEQCGCGLDHADYVENPYIKEMCGDSVMVLLCDDCYLDSVMSV